MLKIGRFFISQNVLLEKFHLDILLPVIFLEKQGNSINFSLCMPRFNYKLLFVGKYPYFSIALEKYYVCDMF